MSTSSHSIEPFDDRPVMDVLDEILANACAAEVIQQGDPETGLGRVAKYHIETHCVAWEITARLVNIYEHAEHGTQYIYAVISKTSESC